jgi:release factor glutamine methyltransferase
MADGNLERRRAVLELLEAITVRLEGAGIVSPRIEAELLLGKALGTEREGVYARSDAELTAEQEATLESMVTRRMSREPLQHILGTWIFCGRQFLCGPGALVPRPETELLVEACLEKVSAASVAWAADVGTGSGVIAVTLALECPLLHVIATDTSRDALELAARNVEEHQMQGRVLLAQGDLAEPVGGLLPPGRAGVELVVSNVPYVPTGEIPRLAPEVRDYDPRCAIDGGKDGLAVVRRLVPAAAKVLTPGGWLVLELGHGQAPEAVRIAQTTGAFASDRTETVADAAGWERVVLLQRGIA